MKKTERNGWYNTNTDIQTLGIKRKIGITISITNENDGGKIKSWVCDYNDMMMVFDEFKGFGNPLDSIDELIRSKDISENIKDELFPKLILSYIPKTKCFEWINTIKKHQIGEWDEFGIILLMSLLKKGIKVEKSIPMKYNEWEKITKEFHKNGINKILGTNLN